LGVVRLGFVVGAALEDAAAADLAPAGLAVTVAVLLGIGVGCDERGPVGAHAVVGGLHRRQAVLVVAGVPEHGHADLAQVGAALGRAGDLACLGDGGQQQG